MQREKIKQSIQPYYDQLTQINTNQAAQKLQELICLGRFMSLVKEDVYLIECTERPDFVPGLNARRMGVELTQLHVQEMVAITNPVKEIILLAEAKLRLALPDLKSVINIQIKHQLPGKFSKRDHDKIAENICNHIISVVAGQSLEDPVYLAIVGITPGDETHIALSETYLLADLDLRLLRNAIKAKEMKVIKYDANKNFCIRSYG